MQIPLIQRDYAQGRVDTKTARIRRDFLATLHDALAGDEPLGLDFVYGDLRDDGTFKPLDGQQRLTTLFLLHWYLAFRSGKLDRDTAVGQLHLRDQGERAGLLRAHRGVPATA